MSNPAAGVSGSNVFTGDKATGLAKGDEKGSEIYRSQNPFGNAAISKYGVSASGTPSMDMFANLFNSFGQNALGQLQNQSVQGLGSQPFDLSSALQGFGANAQSTQFGDLASGFGSALKNFDPNSFAQTQYDRLNAIAGPSDATAANSLANKLFSRGRLGGNDSASGRAFGDLAGAQAAAKDQRALTAIGLANDQTNQIGNLAQQFGLAGSQLQGANLGNILSSFGAQRDDQSFQNNLLQQILGFGQAGQQGGQQAYAPLQQAIQNAFDTKNTSLNAYQVAKAGQSPGGSPFAQLAGSIGGGAVGGYFGGAPGAKVGSQVGSGVGGLF